MYQAISLDVEYSHLQLIIAGDVVSITRRQFIKTLAIAWPSLLAVLASSRSYSALPYAAVSAERQMRIIPSTDEKIPAIGLGSRAHGVRPYISHPAKYKA